MGHQTFFPVININPLTNYVPTAHHLYQWVPTVGEDLTDEDRYEMQSLFDRLKYVEERQSKLKGAVDADLKKVR